ncbi:MAG: hypothetical protein OHK0037_31650 [Elainellaceae cyanobacterium]
MVEGRSPDDRVLVAILKDMQDWAIAREQRWYRIPAASVEKLLRAHWPPAWIAFYQTKAFGEEAYAIRYYAAVAEVARVQYADLFPEAITSPKRQDWYYKLMLGPLQLLEQPIPSQKLRRVTFIPTIWAHLIAAQDVSELLKKR